MTSVSLHELACSAGVRSSWILFVGVFFVGVFFVEVAFFGLAGFDVDVVEVAGI